MNHGKSVLEQNFPNLKEILMIIGGQRCGSTGLVKFLNDFKPISILGQTPPEPRCFLGPNSIGTLVSKIKVLSSDVDKENKDLHYIGEKATTYLETIDMAPRLALVEFPSRVTVLLRNPIERAVSNYRYSCANRLEKLPLNEAIRFSSEFRYFDNKAISTSPFHYLARSNYPKMLKHFKESKIEVTTLILEELVQYGISLSECGIFLSGDDSHKKHIFPRINALEGSIPIDLVLQNLDSKVIAFFETIVKDTEELIGRDIQSWHIH